MNPPHFEVMWEPIDTVPKEKGQVLVTSWEPGDPWATDIELVHTPFTTKGMSLNQSSGNYTRPGVWTYWMPRPDQPR